MDPDVPWCRAARLLLAAHLAFGLPILVLCGDRADYFLAYRCDGADLVAIALGLTYVPGLLVAGLDLLVPALHPVLLFALLLLPDLALAGWGLKLEGPPRIAVAVALSGLWYRYLRDFPRGRGGALCCWLGLLLTPLYFLAWSPIAPALRAVEAAPAAVVPAKHPPVVMVVFDGFGLHELLGPDGKVDADLVPSFARLASRATLYRNVTCNHGGTPVSIPCLLSSRWPAPGLLPTPTDYPDTLFRLLEGTYPIVASEPDIGLVPRCAPRVRRYERSRGERWSFLLRDLANLAPRLLFAAPSEADLGELVQKLQVFRSRSEGAGLVEAGSDRATWFRNMVDSLSAADRQSLVYAYLFLPHPPWIHLPDGRAYPDPAASQGVRLKVLGTNQLIFYWSTDEWTVHQSAQRVLLQVRYCDRLLGLLLDKLEALGMLDPALVVVTTDHGSAVIPGSFPRDVVLPDSPLATSGRVPANAREVLPVPLFVKLPGQAAGSGAISDADAELVDVLPTMAAALGVTIPWKVDGRSLLPGGAGPPARPGKTFYDFEFARHDLPREVAGRLEVPAARRSWFAPGPGASWIYRLKPWGELVGAELPPAAPPVELAVAPDPEAAAPPGVLVGRVEGARLAQGPVFLAFAAGTRVVAVTRTQGEPGGGASYLGFYDPEAYRGARAELAPWLLETDAAGRPSARPCRPAPTAGAP